MPLKEGNTDEVIQYNIKKLMDEGYPRKQAIAIAMQKAGRKTNAKKKRLSRYARGTYNIDLNNPYWRERYVSGSRTTLAQQDYVNTQNTSNPAPLPGSYEYQDWLSTITQQLAQLNQTPTGAITAQNVYDVTFGNSSGGSTTTQPAQESNVVEGRQDRDYNNDGLDDVTGLAIGVKADENSPSGYSYNGIPVTANGAAYQPTSGSTQTTTQTVPPQQTTTQTAPPQQTTTTVIEGKRERDYNSDGLDDVTGLAIGVKADSASPTGYSYNGIPVYPNGAPYSQSASSTQPPASQNGTQTTAPPSSTQTTTSTTQETQPEPGSHFGTQPLNSGWNNVVADMNIAYSDLANPDNVWVIDKVTGQPRKIAPGEQIKAGDVVWVLYGSSQSSAPPASSSPSSGTATTPGSTTTQGGSTTATQPPSSTQTTTPPSSTQTTGSSPSGTQTGNVIEGRQDRDYNNDGLDDVTGLAIGVKADSSSPTGYSYNGIPVYPNGAPYSQGQPANTGSQGGTGTTTTTTGGTQQAGKRIGYDGNEIPEGYAYGDRARDKNGDGIDDSNGLAVGVSADPTSPTGYSYNGMPVTAEGKPVDIKAGGPSNIIGTTVVVGTGTPIAEQYKNAWWNSPDVGLHEGVNVVQIRPGTGDKPVDQLMAAGARVFLVNKDGKLLELKPGNRILEGGTYVFQMPSGTAAPLPVGTPAKFDLGSNAAVGPTLITDPRLRADVVYPGVLKDWVQLVQPSGGAYIVKDPHGLGDDKVKYRVDVFTGSSILSDVQVRVGPNGVPEFRDRFGQPLTGEKLQEAQKFFDTMVNTSLPAPHEATTRMIGGIPVYWDAASQRWTIQTTMYPISYSAMQYATIANQNDYNSATITGPDGQPYTIKAGVYGQFLVEKPQGSALNDDEILRYAAENGLLPEQPTAVTINDVPKNIEMPPPPPPDPVDVGIDAVAGGVLEMLGLDDSATVEQIQNAAYTAMANGQITAQQASVLLNFVDDPRGNLPDLLQAFPDFADVFNTTINQFNDTGQANGAGDNAPAAGAPSAGAPSAGGQAGGNTAAPPVSGTQPASGTPPASGAPPASGTSPGLGAISYSDEMWANSPVMRFLRGEISAAEYATLSANESKVPGVNMVLPAPNEMSYAKLLEIKKNPSSWTLLKQIFSAANRDLDAEFEWLKYASPASQAYETSLVRT